MAGDGARAVTVMCNLGAEPVELENARRLPLLLASRGDVEASEDKVVLPPDTLAMLSGEKNGLREKSG